MDNPISSRRDFMKLGGVTLLAAATPDVPLAPPDKQPPKLEVPPGTVKKTRWAIVGLGQLSLEQLMPAFGECKVSTPTALVSGHPEKANKVADTYGIDRKHVYTYDKFDDIAKDDQIDVVYIVLPNHMHAEYTIRALKAGKHVLCEKPMATSAREARQMCDVAKQTGKKLMIAYRLRYEPFNQQAISIVREQKKLGKIRLFEAQNAQGVKAPNIRLSKETAGGPLGDVGVYCVNAARYITGEEPREVTAMIQQPADDPRFREVPESVVWTMKFPSGVIAACSCGFGSEESRRFRVTCDNGWLELQNAFAYQGQRLLTRQETVTAEHSITPVNHFAAEMDYFSECVQKDKPVLTPGEDGLADMVVIEAIEQAAREGKTVQLKQ